MLYYLQRGNIRIGSRGLLVRGVGIQANRTQAYTFAHAHPRTPRIANADPCVFGVLNNPA